MAVPQRKISHSRKGMRRSHNALKVPSLSRCSKCKQPTMPHRICPNCGHYRGRSVVDMEDI